MQSPFSLVIKKGTIWLGVAVTPSLARLRQEDPKFEATW